MCIMWIQCGQHTGWQQSHPSQSTSNMWEDNVTWEGQTHSPPGNLPCHGKWHGQCPLWWPNWTKRWQANLPQPPCKMCNKEIYICAQGFKSVFNSGKPPHKANLPTLWKPHWQKGLLSILAFNHAQWKLIKSASKQAPALMWAVKNPCSHNVELANRWNDRDTGPTQHACHPKNC